MPPEAHQVFCSRSPLPRYVAWPGTGAPELPAWARGTTALATVRALLAQAGLDRDRLDTPLWNPLADLIRRGDRVALKPNWVRHRNGSDRGLDCLVTHTDVLEAVLHYVLRCEPAGVVIGDAPVQGCDFGALMEDAGVGRMLGGFREHGAAITLTDFRRTILPRERLGAIGQHECRPLEDYVLFDLGRDSALEAITRQGTEFRVTMYDPDLMRRTHGPGRHRYLVAREIIAADVVVSLPKLKTHKKAGLTGALKNMVGINGHKEFLPHHRKGGSGEGGDCYEGRSRVKRWVEDLMDATNRARGRLTRRVLAYAAVGGAGVGRILGRDNNYDGSWSGNDTVWRMCLDLQRILHYGRADGRLAETPQRRVVTLTDGIIAGEGEGPLSPTPVAFGLMSFGTGPPALEWIHARLMGLDPWSLPIVREAFAPHRYPLARFRPEEISVRLDGRDVGPDELVALCGRSFVRPRGWQTGPGEPRPEPRPMPAGAAR
jgi:uncharacterized protein (DUF362 family)